MEFKQNLGLLLLGLFTIIILGSWYLQDEEVKYEDRSDIELSHEEASKYFGEKYSPSKRYYKWEKAYYVKSRSNIPFVMEKKAISKVETGYYSNPLKE